MVNTTIAAIRSTTTTMIICMVSDIAFILYL
jgi:hypothetical protein